MPRFRPPVCSTWCTWPSGHRSTCAPVHPCGTPSPTGPTVPPPDAADTPEIRHAACPGGRPYPPTHALSVPYHHFRSPPINPLRERPCSTLALTDRYTTDGTRNAPMGEQTRRRSGQPMAPVSRMLVVTLVASGGPRHLLPGALPIGGRSTYDPVFKANPIHQSALTIEGPEATSIGDGLSPGRFCRVASRTMPRVWSMVLWPCLFCGETDERAMARRRRL